MGIEVLSDAFLSGAYRRIQAAMLVLFLAAVVPVWVAYGQAAGVGFLLGAAVSGLNFFWLKQSVQSLTARVAEPGRTSKGGSMVFRFLLRYALVAAAAYAMIFSSRSGVRGLLAGLLLSVAAVWFEAFYEVLFALRHKSQDSQDQI